MSVINDPNRRLTGGRLAVLGSRFSILITRLNRRRLSAIALALIAALITHRAIARAQATQASLGTTRSVLVATAPLEPGTFLSGDLFKLESRPVGLVPPGALDSPAAVDGLTVVAAIGAGEPIVDWRLSPGVLGLAANEVAVTIPVPLAPPPLAVGHIVHLVGVRYTDAAQYPITVQLAEARVVDFTDESITMALRANRAATVLEHAAIGSVEVLITPRRG